MLLDVIFAAITTPFYSDERPYLRKLEANVDRYSRSPLAGLLVLGSTGESTHLNDAETAEVLKTAAGAAAPNKSLIAGISRESVRSTLELAEIAAEAGYDAVLVRLPSYYRATMGEANLLTYFRAIADRSPLPVVLYNIPQCVHADLPVELIAELAKHPNIIGIKDSSGDLDRLKKTISLTADSPRRQVMVTPVFEYVTRRMRKPSNPSAAGLITIEGAEGRPAGRPGSSAEEGNHAAAQEAGQGIGQMAGTHETGAEKGTQTPAPKTRTKETGFQVMTGSASIVLEALEAGASGATLALAGFAPQAATDIYNAWRDHDPALARLKQSLAAPVARRIVQQLGIPGVKYACDFNGYFGGYCRLPFLPLPAAQKNEREKLLQNMRN
jgi:dihydrodipicolinate synthase/N-acetylneuraminate lyase